MVAYKIRTTMRLLQEEVLTYVHVYLLFENTFFFFGREFMACNLLVTMILCVLRFHDIIERSVDTVGSHVNQTRRLDHGTSGRLSSSSSSFFICFCCY